METLICLHAVHVNVSTVTMAAPFVTGEPRNRSPLISALVFALKKALKLRAISLAPL